MKFLNIVNIVFLALPSALIATKPLRRKVSHCEEIAPVFGNKTCSQVCYEKNGGCTFNCKKNSFDSCGQTCLASDCKIECEVPGYCLQNCNKGCKSLCSSGTCKQLCSNGHCKLDCSGKVCEQSCAKSSCSLKCNSSVESCTQSCMSGAECRQVECSSITCSQACAKEGCAMECRGKHCHQVCTAPGGRCRMTCHAGAETCVQLCPNGGCVTECHAKDCVQVSHVEPSLRDRNSPLSAVSTRPPPKDELEIKNSSSQALYGLISQDTRVSLRPTQNQSAVEVDAERDDVSWPTEHLITRRFSSRAVRKPKNRSDELYCPSILVALLFIISHTLSSV